MVQEYKRILAPVDGSKGAEVALQKAVRVAVRNNATLLITHVIDTQTAVATSTSGYETSFREDMVRRGEALLADYEKYAHEQGVANVETIIKFGAPKYVISDDLPNQENVDLIMLGATGLNAVERFFIGSVSEFVIRHAPCDVLIVRTDLENTLLKKD